MVVGMVGVMVGMWNLNNFNLLHNLRITLSDFSLICKVSVISRVLAALRFSGSFLNVELILCR